MTQYGFYIDSSRCTGCKTCELACKDFKNLSTDVSFRRIYEYAGGIGSRIMVHGIRMCSLTICLLPATTVATPPVPKCARVVQCINAMTALWW